MHVQVTAGLPEEGFPKAGDLAASGAWGAQWGECSSGNHAPGPHQDAVAGWFSGVCPPGCGPHCSGARPQRPLCWIGASLMPPLLLLIGELPAQWVTGGWALTFRRGPARPQSALGWPAQGSCLHDDPRQEICCHLTFCHPCNQASINLDKLRVPNVPGCGGSCCIVSG